MMKKFIVFLLLIVGFTQNFALAKAKANKELCLNQTRIFDTGDVKRVMVAAANTLQDSDFIIEELEPDLGYMRAKKNFKKRYLNKARFAGQSVLLAAATSYAVFTWGSTAAYTYAPARKLTDEIHPKNAVSDVNVNFEKFGKDKVRVRMTVVLKILQNAEGFSYSSNAPLRSFRIYDKNVYDEFFNQLGEKLN